MRQLLKTHVLSALKETLSDLENVKLVADLDVVSLRDDLRKTITELEKDCTPDYEHEFAA